MKSFEQLTILVIGKSYTEGFALHIAETLRSMGHTVAEFEPGVRNRSNRRRLGKRWEQVKSTLHDLSRRSHSIQRWHTKSLLRKVERQPVDLTIVCHDFLLPVEVNLLKEKTKAPVVLWFPDSISVFQRSSFLNADYDALFFKDPYIVHSLNRVLGRSVYYLPECFNPERHKPCELSPHDQETYGCEIATAGNLYPYRVAFFSQLAEYDVRIWGNPPSLWMDVRSIKQMLQNKFVATDEKSKAFRAAKIVLNNLHPAEIWGINVRAFEIAGVGGFQLIDWRPGLEQLLEDGKEVVSFTDMEDLKGKLDHYLRHEDERREIAHRGMLRAQREHTYENRLELLIDTIFGSGRGFPMPDIAYAESVEASRARL